jgi:hypothetical protein
MGKLLKMFSLAALLGALMMVGGCGDGNDDPVVTNPSVTTSFAATANPDGSATTGANSTTVAAPPGTPGYLGAVTATLPPNTVITAKNADGTAKVLTATPSITFAAPADSSTTGSGTNGVPAPTGFTTLASTAGAVDVQLTGAASATFNPAITITMPVPGKVVGSVIKVYTVTGTTYSLLGSFTVTTAGFVSFPVSSLSWKVGDPNPDPSSPTTTVQPTTTAPTTVVPTTTVPTTTPTTVIPTTTAPTTTPTTVVPTTVVPTTTAPTTTPTTVIPTTTAPTTIPTTVVPTTTPTTVPALDGAALYAGNCQGCHGPLATPTRRIRNKTVTGIRSAGMDEGLSDAQLQAIIAVLP